MLCLEVTLNGVRCCTAGLADGLLTANLTSGTHIGTPPRAGFALDISGYTGEGAVEWATREVYPGEAVVIKVVEADESDPPSAHRTDEDLEAIDKAKGLQGARMYYAVWKRRLEELEQEWGDQLMPEADA